MAKLIPVREAHRFDEEALSRYLAQHLEGCGTLEIQQFAGGQSNPTFLLDTARGRLVLRKKPPGKLLPSAHLIEREFRVIRALDGRVPVPKALHLCEDEQIIGTPFYVMEHVEGRLFRDPTLTGVEAQERTSLYSAMSDTLAALHTIDPAEVGLADYGKPQNYIGRQIARWTKQYEASKTEVIEPMDRLIAELPDRIPDADPKHDQAIAHGDFRPGNLLFAPDHPKVAAILDWELSTLGHPLSDLAYFCLAYRLPQTGQDLTGLIGQDLEALGVPDEQQFVQQYCEKTGRPPIVDWPFYLAFSFFRLAAICQGVYARGLQGNASDSKAKMYGEIAKVLAFQGWSIASEK